MRVYYAGGRRSHSMFVAPAADPRGIAGGVAADWLDEAGEPKTIQVEFVHGAATVPDALGRYLVATGQARRTNLFIPRGVAA